MRKKVTVFIRTEELAQITHTSIETIISLVDYGVVEPAGQTPESWEFDDVMIRVVKKAIRIQHDFDTDVAGTALALELLSELHTARFENQQLRRRLQRFCDEDSDKS